MFVIRFRNNEYSARSEYWAALITDRDYRAFVSLFRDTEYSAGSAFWASSEFSIRLKNMKYRTRILWGFFYLAM